MRGKIKDLTFNRDGEQIVSFLLSPGEDFRHSYDDFNGKELNIEVKEYRKKRSLNANNYAWELITKLADKLRISKEETYFKMLKDYGQSAMISVFSSVDIEHYGLKYYEKAGESVLNGKEYTHYKVYKGSSEFDTREMSIFIDGIVQECENVGIETMTPNEIAKMEALWRE